MTLIETLITPDMAKQWLAKPHPSQRPLNTARVADLVDLIKRGKVSAQSFPQPIIIDSDGALMDGQHRLTAIVSAGIPASMVILMGASPEGYRNIDAGMGRKPGERLLIPGLTDRNMRAWICAAESLSSIIHYGITRKSNPEFAEAFYKAHKTSLEFVHTKLGSFRVGSTCYPIAVRLACMEFMDRAPVAAECFIASLRDIETSEITARKVMNIVISCRNAGSETRKTLYHQTITACVCFFKGVKPTILRASDKWPSEVKEGK
jgi:hypothetical protein